MACSSLSSSKALAAFTTHERRLLAFDLRDPRLYQLPYEGHRNRLIERELDGSFARGETLEFALKCLDHRRSREKTAVLRKRCVPHQYLFVLECRHPIADGLGSFGWHSGPDRRAYLVQGAAGWFRDISKVLINILRSTLASRRRTTLNGFNLLHAAILQRLSHEVHTFSRIAINRVVVLLDTTKSARGCNFERL